MFSHRIIVELLRSCDGCGVFWAIRERLEIVYGMSAMKITVICIRPMALTSAILERNFAFSFELFVIPFGDFGMCQPFFR